MRSSSFWRGAGHNRARVALDNPSEARVLETLRDERLEAARVHVGIDATRVRAELDTARRRGFLDEDTWRDLTVMLDKAAVSERVDLGAVAREISAVADRCAQGRALGLVEFNEEYEIKRHIPGVAERLDEIDRLIALDDLATARDLIARAEVGDAPPTVEETSRSLAEFFPAVPNALAGGLNQGQVSTVTAGGTTAGVDFLGLSAGERTVAERGLQAWYDVANKARVSSWGVPLAPALRILGIDAESSRNAPLPSAADRRWVDLVGVRRTGKALVPAFGSATRDELRLLLCWNSPEVTTLLGWIAQDASEKPVRGALLRYPQPRAANHAGNGAPGAPRATRGCDRRCCHPLPCSVRCQQLRLRHAPGPAVFGSEPL